MKEHFKFFKKLYYALGLILTIVLIGIIGYVLVEDWSVFDAFYMTIITVTTVGFNEVHQMSDTGKLFTAFLIITSFGTFAYAISAVTTYIVSGDYVKYYKEFKKMKRLQKLSNHTIVCGYGRVGNQAAHDLKFYKKKFLVIERSPEGSENDFSETMFIKGDATKDKVLIDAGVKTATALITALPKDADNLFVVLSARELNPNLKIISRASSYSSMRKLRIAGANNVIMPDTVGGGAHGLFGRESRCDGVFRFDKNFW